MADDKSQNGDSGSSDDSLQEARLAEADALIEAARNSSANSLRAFGALTRVATAVIEATSLVIRGPSDAHLQLGIALRAAWGNPFTGDTGPEGEQPAWVRSEVVALSLATFQAFARRCETTALSAVLPRSAGNAESPGGAEPELLQADRRFAQLASMSRQLRRRAHGTAWYASMLCGDQWGDVTGYVAPLDAVYAENVWDAVDELARAVRFMSFRVRSVPPPPGRPEAQVLTATEARGQFVGFEKRRAYFKAPSKPVGDKVVEVWFGTNRARLNTQSPHYGTDRSRMLRVGRCAVFVPKEHTVGTVKNGILFFDHRLQLQATQELDRSVFGDKLKASLAVRPEKRALLYVHGYNTSFENAAIRAAQLAVDLNIQGVTAFFTWPSFGTFLEYPADGEAARASWRYMAEFMDLLRESGAERVDVIAHSMGNQVVARALGATTANAKWIGSMILAAPDVDIDTFMDSAPDYVARCESTTVYVSSRDNALQMSFQLQLAHRLGLAPPVFVSPDVHTVDVSWVADSFLGHGYYGDEPRVIYDIASILEGSVSPASRAGMRPTSRDGQPYWEMVPNPNI